MTPEGFASLRWEEHPRNPLIEPPPGSPIIADPSVLTPDESPDGRWNLFAHSLFGVHRYRSRDGLSWERAPGLVVSSALRPQVLFDGGRWVLLYEKTRAFVPWLPWSSRIEARFSTDLSRWSEPSVLLEPCLRWHHRGRSRSVSNPFALRVHGRLRLYYSGGLVRLDDCGFDEPWGVGLAESDDWTEGFVLDTEPLLTPTPGDRYCNHAAGALKVLSMGERFLGLQNGIYRDAEGRTRSAIRSLESDDGRVWRVQAPPFLRPGGERWKRSHVYALDAKRYRGRWWVYFNARSDWHWTRGREAIGLAIGG